MPKTITAHEATVKTATVEVKALTISGRQVTLSVFRQLQLAPLLDEQSGHLLGVPWGKVNYFWPGATHWDELDGRGYRLHVVWQQRDELRRALVHNKPKKTVGYQTLEKQALTVLGKWAAADIRDGEEVDVSSKYDYRTEKTTYQVKSLLLGDPVSVAVPYAAYQLANWESHRPQRKQIEVGVKQYTNLNNHTFQDRVYEEEPEDVWQARCAQEEARLREQLDIAIGRASAQSLHERADAAAEVLWEFEQAWHNHYAEIDALDQLFIAV